MRQFIIPYLSFKNSLETAKYYEEVFEGKIVYVMYGKDVPNSPLEDKDKVVHLELKIQDHFIYMGDASHKPSDQAMLLLDYKELDVMKKHYENMKKDSKIVQEIKDTFWGAIYGVLEDKYGMKWEFHYMKTKE